MLATQTEPRLFQTTFMSTGHGDLTIEWGEDKHDAMVGHFQALMDKGVTFFKIEEQGKIRKKTVAIPVASLGEITDRKVFIKDADIKSIVDAGLASIASFTGTGEIKTVGRAATAAEAASTDTVAVKPGKGG